MKTTKHLQIPAGRATQVADVQRFMDSVRTQLNMLGGTGADRVLTQRDVKGGVLSQLGFGGGEGGSIGGGSGAGGGASGTVDTPTQPTGVTGSVGEDITFLKWDRPTFGGYAYTEVWRFDADLLGSAALIATVAQPMFSEYVGFDKTVYYWVRHVNTANMQGPYHATAGYKLVTKIDFAALQAALSEKIDKSYFAAALRSQIQLLDAANPVGLVAGQISLSQAQQALANADVDLTNAINLTVSRLGGFDGATQRFSHIKALEDASALATVRLGGFDSTTQRFSHIKALEDASALLARQVSVLGTWDNANGRYTEFSTLKQTTADNAVGIARLGAYDPVAGKYAVLRDLSTVDAGHATRLTTLETSVTDGGGGVGSRITRLDDASALLARQVSVLGTWDNANGRYTEFSTLKQTTADNAVGIARLGAYDPVAGKYAVLRDLSTVDAGHATRLTTLETSVTDGGGGVGSRITRIESAAQKGAAVYDNIAAYGSTRVNSIDRLLAASLDGATLADTIAAFGDSNYNSISKVLLATKDSATKLTALGAYSAGSFSKITALETTSAQQASVINQLVHSKGDALRPSGLAAYVDGSISIVAPSAYLNETNGAIRATLHTQLYTAQFYKVRPNRKYKVRFTVRQLTDATNGGGQSIYAGVATYDGNYQMLTGGAGTHRYCAALGPTLTVAQGLQTYEGVITGEGVGYNEFRPGTVYVRPMWIVNYPSGNGTAEIVDFEIRDITDTVAVETRATAYTDSQTAQMRAEYTLKVSANGRVAGFGLTAGGVSGSAIYLSADNVAIIPPNASSTEGALLPFIYDAASGSILMNNAFIKDLTASKIAGGVLSLADGNIRNLTVFEKLEAPAQFLRKTHLAPELARELAWVDPNAVLTGGTITKFITPTPATTVIGSYRSGGLAPTVRIVGGGPVALYTTDRRYFFDGYVRLKLYRNGNLVSIDGKTEITLRITAQEVGPSNGKYQYQIVFIDQINAVVAASSKDSNDTWSIEIGTRFLGLWSEDQFNIEVTVAEAFGSNGGLIANTLWSSIQQKPTTLAGYGITNALARVGGDVDGPLTFGSFVRVDASSGMTIQAQNAGGVYARGLVVESSTGRRAGAGFYGATDTVYSYAISFQQNWWAAPQFELTPSNLTLTNSNLTLSAGWNLSFGGDYTAGRPTITGLTGESSALYLYPNGNQGGYYLLTSSKLACPVAFDAYLSPTSGALGFFTHANNAKPIAVGGLTISPSYSDVAGTPANGLLVRGGAVFAATPNTAAQEYAWDRSQVQIYSANGADARLAFHRGGYTVTTLVHDGDGLALTNGPLRANRLGVHGTSTTLSAGVSDAQAISVRSGYGYVDIGAMNAGYAHFQTDRPQFYMNRSLAVTDSVDIYSTPYYFGRAGQAKIYTLTARHLEGMATDGSADTLYLNHFNGRDVVVGSSARLIATSSSNQVMARWLSSEDARSVGQRAPNSYGNVATFEFLSGAMAGNSQESYVGSMVYRPYGSGNDWSGGVAHKLHFGSSGKLWHQLGDINGWGDYREIAQFDANNYFTAKSWIYQPTGVGLYYGSGVHFYNATGQGMDLQCAPGLAATSLKLVDSNRSPRGYLYAENYGHIGFLTPEGGWLLRASVNGENGGRLYDGAGAKYMKWSDFKVNTPPPAGLENVISANWIAAGVVQANIIASGGINIDNESYSMQLLTADQPILLKKNGVITFSVNHNGTGYFSGGLGDNTVTLNSITGAARRAINPYYAGEAEKASIASVFISAGGAATTGVLASALKGDSVTVSFRLSDSFRWEPTGPRPLYGHSTYSVKVQRSTDGGSAWEDVKNSTRTVTVYGYSYAGRAWPEPVEERAGYYYDASFSIADIVPITTANLRYRIVIAVQSAGYGTDAGLRMSSCVAEKAAYIKNALSTNNSGTYNRWMDKETGFTIITGRVYLEQDANISINFEVPMGRMLSAIAQLESSDVAAWSAGSIVATNLGATIYNAWTRGWVSYTVCGLSDA